jgi:hypothetical protein
LETYSWDDPELDGLLKDIKKEKRLWEELRDWRLLSFSLYKTERYLLLINYCHMLMG